MNKQRICNIRKNIMKRKSLGCDVELGNVGDTIKYGTILLVGGGLVYVMWRFNLFGGLKWIGDALKDLRVAPKTIAIFEDEQLNTRRDQIEKMFDILRKKADNFNVDYGSLFSEWTKLKNEIKTREESFGKTFYESGKQKYFGKKPSKEKMRDRLDSFRTKVLTALRLLQTKKKFKLDSKWNIIEGLAICIPCLFV